MCSTRYVVAVPVATELAAGEDEEADEERELDRELGAGPAEKNQAVSWATAITIATPARLLGRLTTQSAGPKILIKRART
jgi:hypothetical protein